MLGAAIGFIIGNLRDRSNSPDEQALYPEKFFRKIDDRSKPNAKDFLILTHRLQSLGLTGDAATRARQALEDAT